MQSDSDRRRALDELKRRTREALRQGCANLTELEPLSKGDPGELLQRELGGVLPEGTITVHHIGAGSARDED